jgi:Ca-activated chloride channel family protein
MCGVPMRIVLALLLSSPLTAVHADFDLWRTDEQRAQSAFEAGKFAEAAKGFSDPQRKAAALFRAGQFREAAELYSELARNGEMLPSDAYYNQGTALAKAGDYQAALGPLELAKELDSDNQRARANAEWVRQRLQEQQQPSQQGDDGEQGESGDQNDQSDQRDGETDGGKQDGAGQDAANQDAEQSPESDTDQSDAQSAGTQANDEADEAEAGGAASAQSTNGEPVSESEQATEAWLRQIPDDPARLLRQKMLLKHQREYSRVGDDPQPW